MRECKFKEVQRSLSGHPVDVELTGTFIMWGCDFEAHDGGVGNFTTGIIEMVDGQIKNIPAERIQFTESLSRTGEIVQSKKFCDYCIGSVDKKQCESCDALTGDCFVGRRLKVSND